MTVTEAEWDCCTEPGAMLTFLRRQAVWLVDLVPSERQDAQRRHLMAIVGDRKRYLFACACCHHLCPALPNEGCRQALRVAELFADGLADGEMLVTALAAVRATVEGEASEYFVSNAERTAAQFARAAAGAVRHAAALDVDAAREESAVAGVWAGLASSLADAESQQAMLLRDIVGSPFRPQSPADPAWLGWNDGSVGRLAGSIYDARAFDHMPILADTLEDAGCTDAELLGHLRSPGQHVRGCWAVDLVLGKS
jgi:hypothetical protein